MEDLSPANRGAVAFPRLLRLANNVGDDRGIPRFANSPGWLAGQGPYNDQVWRLRALKRNPKQARAFFAH